MPVPQTIPAPPPPSAPAGGWDTEMFALRGDSRAALHDRARSLVAFLERSPDVHLPSLAATLASELHPGGVRLAVVAASAADLRTRLTKAADRLADPKCKHIRDAAGVYFASEPLAEQGSLALLFPGEGAQYPHMLADLCGVFPEVEETFAWCDQLAADAGRPHDSLRRILHPPADATPAEKAAAEAELRKLGPSIFGVLLADQAVIRVIWNLQLPVAAVAGHSAGELAALLAAGAMRADEVLGHRLVEIMDIMQRQEDGAGGPDVALLAVGGSRAAVEAAAADVAGGAVVVAMDNCPHQCVAVGPTHLVAAVEGALAEKGMVCERLPFRRPYHTPLFEPWMGPFRDLFSNVPFAPPHTPVYCGSTGELFPADPDAVRRLAVDHWVSPVEWTKLIERMYADGVRVFVEAGPRGNLSAFVEDVLRGRPFAAIPANVPRKSGPTQINHMVAQMVAHGVTFNVGHLHANRETTAVEWESSRHQSGVTKSPERLGTAVPGEPAYPETGPRFLTATPGTAVPGLSGDGENVAVLHSYLDVMEQFLDIQQSVMSAFLAGRPTHSALPAFDLDAFLPAEPIAPPFALVGTVDHLVPGREVVVRRTLDEREDLYADHHTLGGRGVSRVDPGQNGLPVLPMTFSLEAMAEAAALLVPGKVVVAVRNVRLFRWLPFDPAPTTLEVRASVASVDEATGVVEVKADVRDLGNSFVADGANKPASEAVVVLADRYPDPPAAQPFTLTDEVPCRSTVDDLRRNMFHGPVFQMIRTLGRTGKEGIEGTLEVQDRTTWFRSDPDPRIALDPVLMDAAMHLLGAWHLEQPDWTGRILLPFEVNRVEFFGPTPPIGSTCVVRGHNEQESARHFRHGLEVFGPDGHLWLRLTGAGYWRFYLPFGHVNFFGPKDEYYLSRNWPEAVGPGGGRCHELDPPVDLRQPVLRAAGARVTMTPREMATFNTWTGTDAGLNDWFFGRLLAKDAARAAWAARHGEALFPADLETDSDPTGRLVVRFRDPARTDPLPPVSVSIADGRVAAFSAFAPRVGVALVTVPKASAVDDEADFSPAEREMLAHFPDRAEGRTRLRAARQAVADALRETGPDGFAVAAADPGSGLVTIASSPAVAARYPDVSARVRVQTARHKSAVVATTTCEPADA